jgi:excisionase family DNA binding protein
MRVGKPGWVVPRNPMTTCVRTRRASRGAYVPQSMRGLIARLAGIPSQYKGHPLTEHALRRTFATLLHASGVGTSTIGDVLGHSEGSTAFVHCITMMLKPHGDALRAIVEGWHAMMAANVARKEARDRGFEPLTYGFGVRLGGLSKGSKRSQRVENIRGGKGARVQASQRFAEFSSPLAAQGLQRKGGLRVVEGGRDRLLSVREVAGRLGVCTASVYALCARGELRHARVLNAVRITPADLDAYVAKQRRTRG